MRHRLPKYVHAYSDRHGKPRIYLRKPGRPRVPLPGPLYSKPFWIAYHNAMKGDPLQQPRLGLIRVKPGSMNALITDYYQSAKFLALAESTRSTYRNQLERFRHDHGEKPVALLKAKHIEAILGKVAETSTAQASKLRKRLNTLMRLAVAWEYRDDNPMVNVERIKHRERGYRTWTEYDISKFRKFWDVGSPQRLAFEILLFTGLRRSDAVRLGRQHLRGGYHAISTKKSGELVQLEIPLHETLARHLSYAPTDHLTYIVTAAGKPRSPNAFTNWIRSAAHAAGLPTDSSPHGLRKAACRRLAEAGCTPNQIMAITGHSNLSEVQRYTEAANKKVLARGGIAAIEDEFETE